MSSEPLFVIARDASGAGKLAKQIDAPGECKIIFSLFDVVDAGEDEPDLSPSRPIIITSRHAVNYCTKMGGLQFYVVGEDTASAINAEGLGHVVECALNVGELLEVIRQSKPKHFTYLRGEHISQDVALALSPNGITVDEYVVYEFYEDEIEIERFESFIAKNKQPLIVPLLSKRTAAIICEIIFSNANGNAYGVALSEAVMQSVSTYDWAGEIVAEKTDLTSLASACTNCFNSIVV